jgi:hypothetical protein
VFHPEAAPDPRLPAITAKACDESGNDLVA